VLQGELVEALERHAAGRQRLDARVEPTASPGPATGHASMRKSRIFEASTGSSSGLSA